MFDFLLSSGYNVVTLLLHFEVVFMTKTKNMNIRIAENDYQAIKQFADFNGKSISALMLDAVWELMEHQEDLKDFEEYEKEKRNGTLETSPWEEVKERLGL